jgi:twitching motility protein PilJ
MKLPIVSAKNAPAKGVAKGRASAPVAEGSKWLGVVIFLLLGAVVMMAIVYSMVAIQAGYDKEYLGLVGEQRVLSQQISKYAGQANRGLPVTFDQLKKYRDEFDHNLRLLRAGNPDTGMPPSANNNVLDKLSVVVRHWKRYNDNVTIIVNARDVVITLREIVRLINENSPQLVALTDEVATKMAQKGAKADQVYIAARQLQPTALAVTRHFMAGSCVAFSTEIRRSRSTGSMTGRYWDALPRPVICST